MVRLTPDLSYVIPRAVIEYFVGIVKIGDGRKVSAPSKMANIAYAPNIEPRTYIAPKMKTTSRIALTILCLLSLAMSSTASMSYDTLSAK